METLIVQLGVRHGRVAELARSQNGALRVGRSFDNDLVLTDLHVAPQQVEFLRNEDKWTVTVLDNTNPVLLNGKIINRDAEAIESGDKITVGRTNLSLYSADHPVEKTRALAWSSWLHRHSKGLFMPILALLLFCALDAVLSFYQGSFNLKWQEYGYGAFALGVFAVIWAGCWALAGRLLRHQQAFGLQLLATSLVGIGLTLLIPFESYLGFITNSSMVSEISSYIIAFIVFAALFRLNLFFATNIKNTLVVSVVFSAILVLTTYGLVTFDSRPGFSAGPTYSNTLKPPFATIGSEYSVDEYFQKLETEASLLRQN